MTRRRLTALAACALIAVAVLTGCRTQPGTAAYVGGGVRYRVDDVTNLVDTLIHDGFTPASQNRAAFSRLAISNLVFLAEAKRYAAAHQIDVPTPDYAGTAASANLPESDPFLRLVTDADAYRTALLDHVASVTPTDQELREVYNNLSAAGISGSYEEIRPQLLEIASIGQGVALRRELLAQLKKDRVSVNPRYAPAGYSLTSLTTGSGASLPGVTLPIANGTASPAVTDLPTLVPGQP